MGNRLSNNNPPPVEPALLQECSQLMLRTIQNPNSLCVVAHDLSRMFLEEHAITHELGAPINAFEITNLGTVYLWEKAQAGYANQDDWIELSNALHALDQQHNNRLVYQRISPQPNSFMQSALTCASKALEYSFDSDAVDALQNTLHPCEQTTLRVEGRLITFYKTENDMLGFHLVTPAETPRGS